ncbi:uncharacterized protein N7496_012167 [Penicillium cataractarum]|uniref:FAD-binding domain-containing protein n=1 Tax=Penicillium cataractarum TaxID=2100454 RepID=A0A9W9UWZ9_9EURO|nr:uncharacterized protein N7496_012167 [Penicillium cataractarum]KAJ5359754.1 hypothetical protein N7496_012167 [Penicillium cataractarum]
MVSSNQEVDKFKVLIAGGSLAGLGLALAFEHAGIEYELFEKGDFAPQLGASIGLHPHTIRILEQLGVWGDIEKQVVPLQHRMHFDEIGNCFEDSHVLVNIEAILERPIVFMERSKALEVLYSHVRDKSKLHARTSVANYDETAEGVIVTTEDGTKHHGHILIGADGIHSKVRGLMAEKISVTDQSLAKAINEAFTSEYNCIFAVSRNEGFLPDGMVHNVYYDDYSAIAAAGVPGLVFWFLFVKSSTLTRMPNCPHFVDEDAHVYIQKYGSSQVGPGYAVKDLWGTRVKATMVPLEEGVSPRWYHDRVVLIGDSVHKATVNPGLGGNTAYEGIARFTNGLVPLLKENPIPSLEQLSKVFNQYITGQAPRAKTVVGLSGSITRYEAQDNWVLKFAARHIVPWVSDNLKARLYASFSSSGPWLKYLPLPAKDNNLREASNKSDRSIAPTLITAAIMVSASAALWQILR